MINVVNFDPKATAVQQVVEIADFLKKEAEEGRITDLIGVATRRDGSLVTFASDSTDHIRRIGALAQLQTNLTLMTEMEEDV